MISREVGGRPSCLVVVVGAQTMAAISRDHKKTKINWKKTLNFPNKKTQNSKTQTYKKRRGHLVCWWVGGCPKHPSHVLFSCISTTHVTKPSKLRRNFFYPCDETIHVTKARKMFSSDKIDQNYQNKPKLSMWPKEEKFLLNAFHMWPIHTPKKHLKNSTYQPVTLLVKSNLKSIER